MTEHSMIETQASTPLRTVQSARALKKQTWHLDHCRPGEGDPTQVGGPINWHGMEDDEYEETWGALCDFLSWAVPHWAFSSEQFPHKCWWLHHDIIEEATSWWGLWQSHVRNPAAPISYQIEFQTHTFQLKQRLEHSYRGRCRHEHQPTALLDIFQPEAD